jgi:hypothetical protein
MFTGCILPYTKTLLRYESELITNCEFMLVLFVIWKLLLKDRGMTILTRILGISNTSRGTILTRVNKSTFFFLNCFLC